MTTFSRIEQTTINQITKFCQEIDLDVAEPRELLGAATSLMKIVKRSKTALRSKESWDTVLTMSVSTIEAILETLDTFEGLPLSFNSSVLTVLSQLSQLAEKEAEAEEQKEAAKFTITKEDFESIVNLLQS